MAASVPSEVSASIAAHPFKSGGSPHGESDGPHVFSEVILKHDPTHTQYWTRTLYWTPPARYDYQGRTSQVWTIL